MHNLHYGTALITGASSGLGAAFARQLAQNGSDLILVARRSDRLTSLADELSGKYGISAQVLVADLSRDEDIARVEAQIDGTEHLSLLVNNAGFGIKDRFSDGSLEKHLDMIQVHILTTIRLLRRALPSMVEHHRGAIINVASMAAFLPYRSSTYAATKAYLVAFSQGLAYELRDTGISIQALCPGFFYSEFHDTPELSGFKRSSIPKIFWLEAEDVVGESLKALSQNRILCIPGVQYKIVAWLARSPLTGALITRIAQLRFGRKFDPFEDG